jgi:integrase/recombinase XerD
MEPSRRPPLADLLSSWEIALKSERKSRSTLANYLSGVRVYLAWLDENGHEPVLTKALVREWVADLLAKGAQPNTAVSRQQAVRRFSAWLVEDGELDEDPLAGLRQPKVDIKVVDALTDEQITAMIEVCAGKDLRDRRDEALIRLLVETGMRASEVINLRVEDIDLPHGLAVVRRGKGGKGRVVPFTAKAGRALDRYMRLRKTHRLASTEALWLGDRGKGFSYFGLRLTLLYRADLAGIKGFHVHQMRHTAATRWLRKGGSEQGLMAVAGWSSRAMLDRYTSASASDRAADESRRLNLGDF